LLAGWITEVVFSVLFPPCWVCSVATRVSGSELKALDSLCNQRRAN